MDLGNFITTNNHFSMGNEDIQEDLGGEGGDNGSLDMDWDPSDQVER